jgi:hypothetical protein
MTPQRVVHPRRLWLLAALAAVLFGLNLLGLEQRDDAWLLKVGGRPLDVRGAAWAAWQDATRDCSAVQRLDPGLADSIGSAAVQAQAHAQAREQAQAPALLTGAAATSAAAVEALRAFSPPDSWSARVRRLDYWPSPAGGQQPPNAAMPPLGWFVVQAEFEQLEPVVVLVRQEGPHAQVLASGVWSGTTLPWNPAWRIRRYLADRVPQAAPLLACLDPLSVFAQPPKPL